INPAYRLAELEYALNASGCRAIVSAERLRTSMYLEMLQTLAPELKSSEPGKLMSKRLPMLQFVIRMGSERTPGMLGYDEVIKRGDAALDIAALDATGATLDCFDAINIQFTSGTTGNPKGATLTHHNVVNNGYFVGLGLGYTAADRVCIPVPFYHCFGMVLGNLACTSHGACMVVRSEERRVGKGCRS